MAALGGGCSRQKRRLLDRPVCGLDMAGSGVWFLRGAEGFSCVKSEHRCGNWRLWSLQMATRLSSPSLGLLSLLLGPV